MNARRGRQLMRSHFWWPSSYRAKQRCSVSRAPSRWAHSPTAASSKSTAHSHKFASRPRPQPRQRTAATRSMQRGPTIARTRPAESTSIPPHAYLTSAFRFRRSASLVFQPAMSCSSAIQSAELRAHTRRLSLQYVYLCIFADVPMYSRRSPSDTAPPVAGAAAAAAASSRSHGRISRGKRTASVSSLTKSSAAGKSSTSISKSAAAFR